MSRGGLEVGQESVGGGVDREGLANDGLLDATGTDATGADTHWARGFAVLNANALEIGPELTASDASRFPTVPTEVFGLAALRNLVTEDSRFSADIAFTGHGSSNSERYWPLVCCGGQLIADF